MWFDLKSGHNDYSPNHGRQDDMSYLRMISILHAIFLGGLMGTVCMDEISRRLFFSNYPNAASLA